VTVETTGWESQSGLWAPETEFDRELALKFGAYASFVTPNDPVVEDYHGGSPADETRRLLEKLVGSDSVVLDLGCGAGFTTCLFAERAASVIAIDLQSELIAAARQRAAARNLRNITFVEGDTTHASTLTHLPQGVFDLVLSRRGPFLTKELMGKLKPDALFVLELAHDFLGLKELFGRTPSLPRSVGESDWAIGAQVAIGMVPVSAKSFWFELYFRNADHLAAYLRQGSPLHNWWMDPCPYEEERDRGALNLYIRYNTTSKGIRLVGHRRVYLFRRQSVDYYPVLSAGSV
jgi:SAM-dependent methyltransferase